MKLQQILSLSVVLISFYCKADSPLTSTGFYTSYKDLAIVKKTIKEQGITTEIFNFLESNAPADHKLAVINALGWGNEGYVEQYEKKLTEKNANLKPWVFDSLRVYHQKPPFYEEYKELNSDQLMCWSYLQVMGDYFNPIKGFTAANFLYMGKPESMAHNLPVTLIACQLSMDSRQDWCNVYLIGYDLLVNKKYSENNLRPSALHLIMKYLGLYKEYCSPEQLPKPNVWIDYSIDVDGNPIINSQKNKVAYNNESFSHQTYDKNAYADLKVDTIYAVYDSEIKGTYVYATVRNTGNAKSIACIASLYNMGYDDSYVPMGYYLLNVIEIPEIGAGRATEIIFKVEGSWLYDPNFDVKVVVDSENFIEEENEEDNSKEIFEEG